MPSDGIRAQIIQFQAPNRALKSNNNGSPPGNDLPLRFLQSIVPARAPINRRIIVFSSDLSANQVFCQAAEAYPEELFHIAKLLLPPPMSALSDCFSMAPIRHHQASDIMITCLISAIKERQKSPNSWGLERGN